MRPIFLALLLALPLAACDHATDNEKNKPEPTAAASPTASIRNVDAGIADRVDSAISANGDRGARLDGALKKSDPSE